MDMFILALSACYILVEEEIFSLLALLTNGPPLNIFRHLSFVGIDSLSVPPHASASKPESCQHQHARRYDHALWAVCTPYAVTVGYSTTIVTVFV